MSSKPKGLGDDVVNTLEEDLERLEEAREALIKEDRDVMLAVRRSISASHARNAEEARERLEEARERLEDMRQRAKGDLMRYVLQVESEYVEARVFYDAVFSGHIEGPMELGVDPRSYLLGLLDAIGECRRLVYDMIREGDLEGAEGIFRVADDIYSKIAHMAVYDRVAAGTKRKLDVAKVVLDDMVRILTEVRARCGASS